MSRDPMAAMFGPRRCRTCGASHYPGKCPEPAPYVMPRIVTAHRHHNHHPWAQPGDRPERLWILRFEDQDRREMRWSGPDAEHEAKEAYRQYAPKWGCTLLASIRAEEI